MAEIFEFDVTVIGGATWRRLRVRKAGTFLDLHRAIHAAFGFEGEHLWAFHERRAAPPFAAAVEEGCSGAGTPDGAAVPLDGWFGVSGRDRCLYRDDAVAGWQLGVELRGVGEGDEGVVAQSGPAP